MGFSPVKSIYGTNPTFSSPQLRGVNWFTQDPFVPLVSPVMSGQNGLFDNLEEL